MSSDTYYDWSTAEIRRLTAQLAAVTAERDEAAQDRDVAWADIAVYRVQVKAATERAEKAEKAEADVVIHWAECEAWRAYCDTMPHALEHAIELDGTHYQPCFRCLYEAVEKAREASDAARKEGTT